MFSNYYFFTSLRSTTAQTMNRLIASRFAFSAEILRNNYYQHAFGHQAATAPDG